MTGMLASVTCLEEAMLALEAGVDIIDLKNPREGALGALPLEILREVVLAVDGRRPISATVGDLPMQPALVLDRVEKTAATGVDIVKVGFVPHPEAAATIDALAPLAKQGVRLVAVLFADQAADFGWLPQVAQSGFYGVMLDTANKRDQGLLGCLPMARLRIFIETAKRFSLLSGLAGSLREGDIPSLASLAPHYLGFRGALCASCNRESSIQDGQLRHILQMLRKYNKPVICAG